jgi:hypothetical protein
MPSATAAPPNGYNTLTMAFADATGLTSASTLPEPV